MGTERHDLNGRRLVSPGSSEIWLVFHGRRHLLADPTLVERLFESTDLTVMGEIDDIVRGPDVGADALLLRAGEGGPIYLFTAAHEGGMRKHLISDEADLRGFDFDAAKAVTLPPAVVRALPSGRDLARELV